MTIKEVNTAQTEQDFLRLPVGLYEKFPHWIRPLDQDITWVSDPERNKSFRTGACIRWVLYDRQGAAIGRLAAFFDKKNARKGNDQPTGGIGLFECINDRDAAFCLFDQARQWLQTQGMEAMDGPINFGNRDRWWGLLVEGFDQAPNYQCNYNPPYYRDFFEAYGFQPYFYQLTYGRKIAGPLDERMYRKAKLVASDPDYRFDYVRKKNWDILADKIRTVYNQAWANRGEIPELTDLQAKLLVKQMKPILDEKLIWFGYYRDEPIAFLLALPEVNQIFRFVNGRLDLLGKLKFLWYSQSLRHRKAFGVLFGVVPAHHGKGVDGAIIEAFREFVQVRYTKYEDFELNWIGDFNIKMIRVCEQINAQIVKKHCTYRKLFDETKPFRRFPIKH